MGWGYNKYMKGIHIFCVRMLYEFHLNSSVSLPSTMANVSSSSKLLFIKIYIYISLQEISAICIGEKQVGCRLVNGECSSI